MTEEEPRRQLVSKAQYLGQTAEGGLAFFFAIVFGCGGLFCLVKALIAIVVGSFNLNHEFGPVTYLVIGGVLLGIGVTGLYLAKELFDKAASFGPIAPITKHNIRDLPKAETLVRGSGRSDADTELLRTAQIETVTASQHPPRATQTDDATV